MFSSRYPPDPFFCRKRRRIRKNLFCKLKKERKAIYLPILPHEKKEWICRPAVSKNMRSYEPRREYYPTVGWEFEDFELVNLTEKRRVPTAMPCFFSHPVDLEGKLLWLSSADVEHLKDFPVRGRICMVEAWSAQKRRIYRAAFTYMREIGRPNVPYRFDYVEVIYLRSRLYAVRHWRSHFGRRSLKPDRDEARKISYFK